MTCSGVLVNSKLMKYLFYNKFTLNNKICELIMLLNTLNTLFFFNKMNKKKSQAKTPLILAN